MRCGKATILAILLLSMIASWSGFVQAQESPRLRDRGPGQPTSMFNTFIAQGDWLVYPFFELYVDSDAEYKPEELGHSLDQDFRGEYFATEELIFIGYGLRDWLALELEAAIIQAELSKSDDDPSSLPSKVEESGLGDVEGQVRWRYTAVREQRPEFFGYFEWVAPTQDEGSLIGTTEWEFKLGSGAIRSFEIGSFALRAAFEYSVEESKVEAGEYAVEYMRRYANGAGVYLGVEGGQDEVALIGELQWRLAEHATLKLGSGFGITSKATDIAPEVGVLFRF
jgi:hypothetical protein